MKNLKAASNQKKKRTNTGFSMKNGGIKITRAEHEDSPSSDVRGAFDSLSYTMN